MAAATYTATMGSSGAGGSSFIGDAEFRAWGSGLNTLLAAQGLVQTSDTGQINWTTVTRASAQNTAQGYEIWRFNDTLQSTAPVYIKLEFGTGPGNGGYLQGLAVWTTIGSGTNGSGTLTGQVSSRRICSQYASASTPGVLTNAVHYVSAASNRVAVCFTPSTSYTALAPFGFSIERAKDATGADTAGGVFRHCWGHSSSATTFAGGAHQFIPFPSGTAGGEDTSPVVATHGQTSAVGGTDVGVFPIFPAWGYLKYPSTNLITYKNADITSLATVPVTLYNTSRTYLALGGGANQFAAGPRGLTNESLLMRYD